MRMTSKGKAASLFVLFLAASALVSRTDLFASITVQQATLADDIRAYKLMNIPPNSTGSCKSRFGEGAQAGKLDCECKGGFMWNKEKTECVSDGTPQDISYFERLTQRVFRRFGVQSSSAASSAQSSVQKPSAQAVATKKPAGCFVKGTVTEAGDKYYFVPGCPSYDDIVIDMSRNEKRFCSEELAENAGWTRSPTCG